MAETASIKVDFNSVTEHGRVKASTRRADGPVAEGDHVIAYDPYERLAYPAVVVAINEATGGIVVIHNVKDYGAVGPLPLHAPEMSSTCRWALM